jgi:hypothetical protein
MKNISLKTIPGSALVRKPNLIFVVLAFVATLAPSQARAAEFYAIIANLNGASNPRAQIDVALDIEAAPGAYVPIQFNVFRADGTHITEFQIQTNADGFASTSSAAFPNNNLFNLSEGMPALVKVTMTNIVVAAAVLRQTLDKSNVILGVPSANTARTGVRLGAGVYFPLAIGDISHKAFLLMANISGIPTPVDIFLGTTGGPGSGKYTNGFLTFHGLWIVELDPADANKHMIVRSGNFADLVVQLAFDNGKKDGFTEVTVLPAH